MTPSLVSTTTGKVFQQLKADFYNTLPKDELPATDPFTTFWQDFRNKILTPGNCQPLLEAYTSVYAGNTSWANGLSFAQRGVRIQELVDIIHHNPPDIVIIGPSLGGYGFHLRQPDQWPYICISKYWVDEWRLAMGFNPNRRLTLSLEAVLRATLVHELAHWLFTLHMGTYSQEYLNSFEIRHSTMSLSSEVAQDAEQKTTPKSIRAEWRGDSGEAGDYVELNAGGGIAGFNVSRDDVFIRTDVHAFWSPSTPFLFALRDKGYLRFVPGSMDMPMPQPPITLCIPSMTPSTQPGPSRSRMFGTDICDSIEGGFDSDFIGEISKHGNNRILGPSALKRWSEQEGVPIGLGFHYY